MNQLLILSILAVMPLMEGLEITSLTACTLETNDLKLACNFMKKTGIVNYRWDFRSEKNQQVVASSTNPGSVAATYKQRAKVTMTDTQVNLILTGFGSSDSGNYTCNLFPSNEQESNRSVSVKKDAVLKCSAPGLLLNTPWMLSLLLLFPVLQALELKVK
ncbi:thy-1 membrane glycoprotein-like [Hypanus sabinus]|uniref:thy-1 membrane glycoprotein-like n=1 Tax=Hypanus sabinus TaxID=79690 RepID=UPI0028C4B7D9|nr:thy-1 membrane glycoprotein-like [Hypanus sabinus]